MKTDDKKKAWIQKVVRYIKAQTPEEFERKKEKLMSVFNADDETEQAVSSI